MHDATPPSSPAPMPFDERDPRGHIARTRFWPTILALLVVLGVAVAVMIYADRIASTRLEQARLEQPDPLRPADESGYAGLNRSLDALVQHARAARLQTLLDSVRGQGPGLSAPSTTRTPASGTGRAAYPGLTDRYRAGRATATRPVPPEQAHPQYYAALRSGPLEADWPSLPESASNGRSQGYPLPLRPSGSEPMLGDDRVLLADERAPQDAYTDWLPAFEVEPGPSAGGPPIGGTGLAAGALARLAGPPRSGDWARAAPSKTYAAVEPTTPYELRAGTVIPCYLLTEINSDHTGDISCMVREDVYDQQVRHVLIPKGARLLGRSETGLAASAETLLALWYRLVYPDGRSVLLPGAPAVQRLGQTGLAGRTNRHWGRVVASAALVGLVGAGYAATQPRTGGLYGPTAGAAAASAVARDIQRVTNRILDRAIVPPTIAIASGVPFLIYVQTDVVLPAAYPDEWTLPSDPPQNR